MSSLLDILNKGIDDWCGCENGKIKTYQSGEKDELPETVDCDDCAELRAKLPDLVAEIEDRLVEAYKKGHIDSDIERIVNR